MVNIPEVSEDEWCRERLMWLGDVMVVMSLSQPSGAGGEDKTKYLPGRLVTQCFPSQQDEHRSEQSLIGSRRLTDVVLSRMICLRVDDVDYDDDGGEVV